MYVYVESKVMIDWAYMYVCTTVCSIEKIVYCDKLCCTLDVALTIICKNTETTVRRELYDDATTINTTIGTTTTAAVFSL